MKTCSKCKIEKDLASFSMYKSSKDGLHYYCRECNTAKTKKWRHDNPEKAKEVAKKTRAANPEKEKERIKRWRIANPEKCRKQKKEWRLANPEKEKEHSRKQRLSNPEIKKNAKKWRMANPKKVKEEQKRWRMALSDRYIAGIIKLKTNLSSSDIIQYPELIEAKRAQLKILRTLRQKK